jgi:hypothetical protein
MDTNNIDSIEHCIGFKEPIDTEFLFNHSMVAFP